MLQEGGDLISLWRAGRVDSETLPGGVGVQAVSPARGRSEAESLDAGGHRQMLNPAGRPGPEPGRRPPSFVTAERPGAGAVLAPLSGRETGGPFGPLTPPAQPAWHPCLGDSQGSQIRRAG